MSRIPWQSLIDPIDSRIAIDLMHRYGEVSPGAVAVAIRKVRSYYTNASAGELLIQMRNAGIVRLASKVGRKKFYALVDPAGVYQHKRAQDPRWKPRGIL